MQVSLSNLFTGIYYRLGYINRNSLFADIKFIYKTLPEDLKPIFHEKLKAHRFIKPRFQALAFPDLLSKHLSKIVNFDKQDALISDFGTREGFALKRKGEKLKIISEQIPANFPLAFFQDNKVIDKLGIRAILFSAEKPLSFDELFQNAKDRSADTQKDDLKKQLKKLRGEGKVSLTIDSEYFWSAEVKSGEAGKEFLLQNGTLFPLYGTERLISKKALDKRLKNGKAIKIFKSRDFVFALKKTFEELAQKKRISKVFGDENRIYYFLSQELKAAKQIRRIVCGIKDGDLIHIYASRASIAHHSQEIYAYEIENLINILRERGEIEEHEMSGYRHQLLAIHGLWRASGVAGSVFQNLYLAIKMAEARGNKTSIRTALLSIVPYSFLRKASLDEIVEGSEREEVLEKIYNLKAARGMPFSIPTDDHHFIQNFIWMLVIFMKDLNEMGLLLHDKLKRLLFGPKKASPEEIKYLYARLAERFEFTDLPDNLENLIFKIEKPDKHEEYREKIEFVIGMSLPAAKRYLAEFAQKLKNELVEHLEIPREAIHIDYHRKTEAAACEKVETRAYAKFEELWDLLQIKVVIDSKRGTNETEEEKNNLDYLQQAAKYLTQEYMLKYGLPTKIIDDYIANPKKSGWQALTLKALGPQKKRVEIQLMTQKMYENERFLRIRQTHPVYAIQRVLKSQKFDEYPFELLERLTGNPEHDYPLIRNHLLNHWAFVFVPRIKDPRVKISEHTKKNLIRLILEGRIELEIKRLPLRATPVDLAAGIIRKGTDGRLENLVASYGGAEIYHFSFDEKSEEPIVRPYDGKLGMLPKWGINYQLQNGDIVFLRELDSPFGGKILEGGSNALAHCQRSAAKITLRRLLNDRTLASDIARGKEEMSDRFPKILPDAIQNIAYQYKFLSQDDLYAAVGSGIIQFSEIEEIHKQVVIEIKSKGTDRLVRLRFPDRRGVIKFIFDNFLKNRGLLQLYSSSPYYLFGERRAEIILRMHPLSLNIETLTEHFLRFINTQSERYFPPDTFLLTIRVKSSEKNWNHLRRLTEVLEENKINILRASLPEVKPGEIKEGTLEVEVPIQTFSDLSILDLLNEDIKKQPGVMGISH
ncbi:hypothetical protein AMJ44_02670 [candidate division WOR-1 bacterium DG_54_3]|uniref:RelA/SpoT domain-containing protein n=1 Tax=candidate division WOR-1 bacterium DG_54_3 TaxID=1703775 RepID=A0A0S7Y5S4_UNCSA|nr:MAG: hypothetical protein AMJ44_02670 [candidate division WOR-1 bacterium DG_54_3]